MSRNRSAIARARPAGSADMSGERIRHAVDGARPQLKPPNPNDPRSLRLATMVRQIARARVGGRTGRWRRHRQGSRRRSRCPRARCQHPGSTRRRRAPASLVDEVETTEVEMTHD
jgi:hypothetical protein